MSIPEGAKTSTYLAASREVDEHDYRYVGFPRGARTQKKLTGSFAMSCSGKYFTPIATETDPSHAARDRELAKHLWKISEDFVAKNDPQL